MPIAAILSRSSRFFLVLNVLFGGACTRKAPEPLIVEKDMEKRRVQAKAQYLLRCSSCHGEFGEGKIGPNLTDDYWLHGDGTKGSLVMMIADGATMQGMPAWKNVYHADDISAIADFVQTLQGTNPKGAKAPQGHKK